MLINTQNRLLSTQLIVQSQALYCTCTSWEMLWKVCCKKEGKKGTWTSLALCSSVPAPSSVAVASICLGMSLVFSVGFRTQSNSHVRRGGRGIQCGGGYNTCTDSINETVRKRPSWHFESRCLGYTKFPSSFFCFFFWSHRQRTYRSVTGPFNTVHKAIRRGSSNWRGVLTTAWVRVRSTGSTDHCSNCPQGTVALRDVQKAVGNHCDFSFFPGWELSNILKSDCDIINWCGLTFSEF